MYYYYGATSLGIIIFIWGLNERKMFPGFKINATMIFGLILMIIGLIYQIYSNGILGLIFWISAVIIGFILEKVSGTKLLR